MHILGLVLILLLGAAIFGPQLWVRHVLQRHGADRPDFPGTGSELAEHLIAEHGLDGVKVQTTEKGDHYDPQTRTVCLSRETHAGKSLTAVAVAAHEVGHALQHARNEKGLKLRQSLVGVAALRQRLLVRDDLGRLGRVPARGGQPGPPVRDGRRA